MIRPRLIRPLFAAAAVLAASTTTLDASAQSAVLYGLVDASGSRTKPIGPFGHESQLDSGNMTPSFIGFRGSEDLGGGVRAVFRLESYVRVDTGATGRTGNDTFWSRDSNVGLSGAFGTTVLGRSVTPLYLTTVNFNPFGESFGFSPSLRQYYAGAVLGDRSWNNSIAYASNPTSPLRINFAANLPEGTAGADGRNYGGSASYITGPFAAAVAVERIKNSGLGVPAGFSRQVAAQASATYDFKFVRVYGQVGHVSTHADDDAKTTLYQLGVAVPIGNGLILAAYGHSKAKNDVALDSTDRTSSIGYDYFLSKNTDIYAAALYEKASRLSSGNTIAGGVRLRF